MSAPVIRFDVYGSPAPQGSKRFVGVQGGRGRMVESSKRVAPWREDVRQAALLAMRDQAIGAVRDLLITGSSVTPAYPLDAPLVVRMVFTMPKPASAPKRRRTWPSKVPDLSKLVRSTEDALTSAGLWKDDARVVEYSRLAKVYPGEDAEALDAPGVRIEIRWANEAEVARTVAQAVAP